MAAHRHDQAGDGAAGGLHFSTLTDRVKSRVPGIHSSIDLLGGFVAHYQHDKKASSPFHALLQTRSSKFEKTWLAVREGKVGGPYKILFFFSVRTIYRWISRFYLGCMENLRNRMKTGRPRQGTDQHAVWIRTTVVDQAPAQCQCEFAWWIAQRVRQAFGEKFGSVLSVFAVRRILRWLPLTPQRPQRCGWHVRVSASASRRPARESQRRGSCCRMESIPADRSTCPPSASVRTTCCRWGGSHSVGLSSCWSSCSLRGRSRRCSSNHFFNGVRSGFGVMSRDCW